MRPINIDTPYTWPWGMLFFCLILAGVSNIASASHDADRSHYLAPRAADVPTIDGAMNEHSWERAEWKQLEFRWLGPEYTEDDFSGRYKVIWTPEKIFLLAEITDDILIDRYRDPLKQYWDDDCLEIFIDEDFSGGNHQYNHNAFAYHLSLDNQAIDIGTDKKARSYSHHVESQWKQQGDKIIWEVSIDIYGDDYRDDVQENQIRQLSAGKIMGFMVAYCDNDGSEIRENFIGSEYAAGSHKDRGWIDAGLFGKLQLVD